MGLMPLGNDSAVLHPVAEGPLGPFVIAPDLDGDPPAAPDQAALLRVVADALPVGLTFQGAELLHLFIVEPFALAKEDAGYALPGLGGNLLHRVGIQEVADLFAVNLQVHLEGVFGEPVLFPLSLEDVLFRVAELVALFPLLHADSIDLFVAVVAVEAFVCLADHDVIGLAAKEQAVSDELAVVRRAEQPVLRDIAWRSGTLHGDRPSLH